MTDRQERPCCGDRCHREVYRQSREGSSVGARVPRQRRNRRSGETGAARLEGPLVRMGGHLDRNCHRSGPSRLDRRGNRIVVTYDIPKSQGQGRDRCCFGARQSEEWRPSISQSQPSTRATQTNTVTGMEKTAPQRRSSRLGISRPRSRLRGSSVFGAPLQMLERKQKEGSRDEALANSHATTRQSPSVSAAQRSHGHRYSLPLSLR